jgi:hypothetical protein
MAETQIESASVRQGQLDERLQTLGDADLAMIRGQQPDAIGDNGDRSWDNSFSNSWDNSTSSQPQRRG